ncbi:hypothetical protein BKA69DRAFT_1040001 [Paraphysoderma sedebokerense]|nr:hypothetical protein BKA69DRAFT_1040001 [Paraphysoderma sedebokerense]
MSNVIVVLKPIKSKAPNWPFAGEKSAGNNPSAGFPKELSNASQIAEDCASQVKGQPGNDKGNGGGKTGGGNGGNPSSGGGGDGNGNSGGKDGAADKPAIPPKSNC